MTPGASSESAPRWTLLVDLTGGNFPDARSVLVSGDWDAPPARIREMAAEHYGVPLSKVAWPSETGRAVNSEALLEALAHPEQVLSPGEVAECRRCQRLIVESALWLR